MESLNTLKETLDLLQTKGEDSENILKSLVKLLESNNFYHQMEEKFGNVKWERAKLDELEVGDLVYCDLGYGYSRELRYGHWCYVVKRVGLSKVLVIPLVTDRNNENSFRKTIRTKINNINTTSTLSLSDMRYMDTMRIDFRRGKGKALTPVSKVNEYIVQSITGVTSLENENPFDEEL